MSIERLQSHYGFTRMPFGKDLAPGMLHAHGAHAEAVARMSWCISEQAIGVISGECGAGKTVAARAAVAGLDASRHTIIYLGTPGVGLRGIYGLIITTFGGTPRFHHAALIPQAQELLAAEHGRARQAGGPDHRRSAPARHREPGGDPLLVEHGDGSDRPVLSAAARPADAAPQAADWARSPRWISGSRCATRSRGLDTKETHSYVQHHLALAGRSDTLFSDDAIGLIHDLQPRPAAADQQPRRQLADRRVRRQEGDRRSSQRSAPRSPRSPPNDRQDRRAVVARAAPRRSATRTRTCPRPPGWPTPPGPAAYHGLLGEIVRGSSPRPRPTRSRSSPSCWSRSAPRSAAARTSRSRRPAITHTSSCCSWVTAPARPQGHIMGSRPAADLRAPTRRSQSGSSPASRAARGWCGRSATRPLRIPAHSDRRLLALEPEFASVLKAASREISTLSPTLRSAWDGRPLAVLTRTAPARATRRAHRADRAHHPRRAAPPPHARSSSPTGWPTGSCSSPAAAPGCSPKAATPTRCTAPA